MKGRQECRIILKEYLTNDIVSMWLEAENIAKEAVPGQFVSVYCDSKSELLPRPISICDTDGNNVRLVFRIVGKGTGELAGKEAGETASLMGPLGNGYMEAVKRVKPEQTAMLIGGGIGIPPMLKLAKSLSCRCITVLGYRDVTFLENEFEGYSDVYIASEDGKHGTKGNVIDAIEEGVLKADIIFACGPNPMLRGIKSYAVEHNIPAYVSLEEKMACGIGACLACVCSTAGVDPHSMVNNKRICKDGPVFDVREVDF